MFHRIRLKPEQVMDAPREAITWWLESMWNSRHTPQNFMEVASPPGRMPPANHRLPLIAGEWDHLIYAYLIENTRAEEIVRQLAFEVLHNERIAVSVSDLTHRWMQNTEDIFCALGPSRNAALSDNWLGAETSHMRRNAYFQMFGVELSHGTSEGRPPAYEKDQVANRDFIPTFEAFLLENWRAIQDPLNQVESNPTSALLIADRALKLQSMLNERRGDSNHYPNFARLEFTAVTGMSWLHLLVATDNVVLNDFNAVGSTPEERLALLGQRVGIAAHPHSDSLFILAPVMSELLNAIEAGTYSNRTGVALLHQAPQDSGLLSMIDHWSRATGRSKG